MNRYAIAVAVVALTVGCQPARSTPEPVTSALVVRNSSAFDINVYAIPTADAKPIWLGTVAAAATRSVPLVARTLNKGSLVVQAQAIGSSRTWTSDAVAVSALTAAVLDLSANWTGDCSSSQLRSISIADLVGPIE